MMDATETKTAETVDLSSVDASFTKAILKSAELMTGRGHEFSRAMEKALEAEMLGISKLFQGAIRKAIVDPDIQSALESSVRDKLVEVLMERYSGLLRKRIDALRSNPVAKADLDSAIGRILNTYPGG